MPGNPAHNTMFRLNSWVPSVGVGSGLDYVASQFRARARGLGLPGVPREEVPLPARARPKPRSVSRPPGPQGPGQGGPEGPRSWVLGPPLARSPSVPGPQTPHGPAEALGQATTQVGLVGSPPEPNLLPKLRLQFADFP